MKNYENVTILDYGLLEMRERFSILAPFLIKGKISKKIFENLWAPAPNEQSRPHVIL